MVDAGQRCARFPTGRGILRLHDRMGSDRRHRSRQRALPGDRHRARAQYQLARDDQPHRHAARAARSRENPATRAWIDELRSRRRRRAACRRAPTSTPPTSFMPPTSGTASRSTGASRRSARSARARRLRGYASVKASSTCSRRRCCAGARSSLQRRARRHVAVPLDAARLEPRSQPAARGARSDRPRPRSAPPPLRVARRRGSGDACAFWPEPGCFRGHSRGNRTAAQRAPFRRAAASSRSGSSRSMRARRFISASPTTTSSPAATRSRGSSRGSRRGIAGGGPPAHRSGTGHRRYARLFRRQAIPLVLGLARAPAMIASCRRSFRPRLAVPEDGDNAFVVSPRRRDDATIAASRREWGMTQNDLFLAILLKTLSPLAIGGGPQAGARELAVASIVNIRGDFGPGAKYALAPLLASFRISHPVPEGVALRTLVERSTPRRGGSSAASSICRRCSPVDRGRSMAVPVGAPALPLLRQALCGVGGNDAAERDFAVGRGGVSGSAPEYLRGVSTGPLSPMVVALSTSGDVVNVGISFRTTAFERSTIDGLVADILRDIKSLQCRELGNAWCVAPAILAPCALCIALLGSACTTAVHRRIRGAREPSRCRGIAALEERILALDPERISDDDVRNDARHGTDAADHPAARRRLSRRTW